MSLSLYLTGGGVSPAVREIWVEILFPSQIDCVILDKLFNFSEPQFPHLSNKDDVRRSPSGRCKG